MKYPILFLSLSLLITCSACNRRIVDFTIISTKNFDFSKAGTFKRSSGGKVTGEDKVHIILTIPLGNPDMKTAIDRAIESTHGAVALIDGVMYYRWQYYMVV